MFIPRPLIISIALIAALILIVSFVPSVPGGPLLEIFTLGVLVAIIVSWVYQRRDPEMASSHPSATGATSTNKLQRMAAEIKALRQHQKEVLLDLPLGVCELNSKESIVLWNRALEKMTSINGEQIRNTRLTDLEEPWLSLLHNFVQSDYTHLYKQGFELNDKKRTVNLHKSLIGQGQAEESGDGGILLLIEDVTETEILEASLTHSERLASIGRLAAGVAHEIGNPITGIACLAQNIRDEYEDEELRHMARQIVEQTERTSKIVQSLVNFAHAGRPVDNSSAEVFRLRDCIDEAITLISLDKQAKAVNYEIDCPSNIQIRGDFQRLLQVLLNLINNSRDASHPETTIWVSCAEIGNKVRVVVEDEGVGIPPAVRDRVFDPFFTTKEPGKGTGLGLSLVYSIVEDLAGNIDIISPAQRETGRGTRVEIALPAQNNSAPDTVTSTDQSTSSEIG